MPKIAPALLVATGLLVLAALLNPSAERHRTQIKAAVAERSQLENLLGVGQLTAFASKYRSVWVGSYTTVGEKLTSVGAFGMVFVVE